MKYKLNPITGELDIVGQTADDIVNNDARYLKLDTTNGPLTGELVITPDSGDTALTANKNIVLKAGQKLIFDGD